MNEDHTTSESTHAVHQSEAQPVTYQDPNAPKPKRKIHVWRVLALIGLVGLLLAGAVVAYMRFIAPNNDSSVVSDYSGGIADSQTPESQVTPETEVARKFLEAVQANDASAVQQVSSQSLKQLAVDQTGNADATVLTMYEGSFNGLDLASLISTVSDSDTGKRVLFADKAAGPGSTGTYGVEVTVVTENNQLKIAKVNIGLSL